MFKVHHKVKIANYGDLEALARGMVEENELRKVEVTARINSGATHLSVPESVAKELGLRVIDYINVRYANNEIRKRQVGSVVEVEILGRRTRTSPIIETNDEVLVGNPILEELNILINTRTGGLFIDPNAPDLPVAELM